MKVLYIQDVNLPEPFNRNILKEFYEDSDVTTREGFDQAREFIINSIIVEKKYIDFIVAEDSSMNNQSSIDFSLWLRGLEYETYFQGYFKITFLPIVLFTNELEAMRDYPSFNRIINHYHSYDICTELIGYAISNWRQQLVADLDCLDLDLTLNYKSFDQHIAIGRSHKLKILSQKFIEDRYLLKFIWLGDNLKAIDISRDEFQKMVKDVNKNINPYKEKGIHSYLKSKKVLLLGEFKCDFLYEKHFYYQRSQKYVEPDFINIPFTYTNDLPEVFEVKLPNQRFSRYDGKDILASTKRHISQVMNKYYNYFSSTDNVVEIQKRANIAIHSFDYTLLMGSKKDKAESIQHLPDFSDYGVAFQIISYDDLFERFERLYERTKKYKVS